MKNSKLLLLLLLLVFSTCKNNSSSSKSENTPAISNEKKDKTPTLSTEETIDYWTKNNCTLGVPRPTVPEEKRPTSYAFEVNTQKGFGKETMILENGYTLEILSKGCNARWVNYSFSFPAKDFDVKNTPSVSQKIIELIKLTSQFSQPSIDLKSKITPLQMAATQIGPFQIGEEFMLKDGLIRESFVLEKVKAKDGKVFLDYYFTQESH
ncbi:MAG TPA: hypothetical protein ENJ53_11380 [Phaeodactylibacter sp.]|nr:hypothetical protein [Phaeodactylibacter sp.]